MADPVLTSPASFPRALAIICRSADEPMRNDSFKDQAMEALDIQRGRIWTAQEMLPATESKLGKGKSNTLAELNRMRGYIGSRIPEHVDFAVCYLVKASNWLSTSGTEEKLNNLTISNMTYQEARDAIYNTISEADPDAAKELFSGSNKADFNETKNKVMLCLVESAIQISYANAVIAEGKARRKAENKPGSR